MKKLLSFILILALVLSSISFAFAEPDTWAFADSEKNKLQAYDEKQSKWENANIKGYKELEYVWFRYISDNTSISRYQIEFDYFDTDTYGFDEVAPGIDFYDSSGTEIDMSGKYDTDVDKSTVDGIITLTIDITDNTELPDTFAFAFAARLAGPGQSSQWPGASLHARLVTGGNKEVSIALPPYGTLDVTKTFVGDERPNEVVIQFSGDYNYEITLNAGNSWHGVIPNVEPGDYDVSEEDLGEYWSVLYDPATVTVNEKDTSYVEVTNTYDEPEYFGDVMFHKYFEFLDEGTTPASVNINWGDEDVVIDSDDGWTELVEDMPVGSYPTSEDSLGSYWTYEIMYAVGETTPTSIGTSGDIPVVDGQTTHVFIYNTYDEPEYFGDVMFHKYFEFLDEGTTPASVNINWGDEDVVIDSDDGWTELVEDMPVGSYPTSEDSLGSYWTYEIMYAVGETTPTSIGTSGDIPVVDGQTTHVFIYNTYDEPTVEEYGTVVVNKEFTGADTPEEIYIEYQLWEDGGSMIATASALWDGEGWTATFMYVDPGDYYIVEVPVPGWTLVAYDPDGFTLQSDGTVYVMVVNDYNDEPTYTVDIEKTVDPTSHYTGGGPVTYTVTFENTSSVTYGAFWVMDEADWFVPENASDFNSDMDGVPITTDGDIFFNDGPHAIPFGPGSVVTATWKYDSSDLSVGTYQNTVTGCAWLGGIYESQLTDQVEIPLEPAACDTDSASFTVRSRTITRDDDPGVRIEKDVDMDEASVGDTVTYTIEVTNNGDVSLTDVVVVDDMIGVEWEIGTLGVGDSESEEFEYTIQEGDFEDGEFVNVAEVTADSREGSVSDEDDATVEEETIDVPPVTPPETPPEIVPPLVVPPQALPQTGQAGAGIFYGLGSLLLAAGYGFRKKERD